MRKYFSIGRNKVTLIISLVIVATFGAWYYLVYIPRNERELYEQHFRWLQRTDANIRAKIDASDSLISNLLRACIKFSPGKVEREAYINKYSSENATLSSAEIPYREAKNRLNGISNDTETQQFFLNTDSTLNEMILTVAKVEATDSMVQMVSMHYDFEKFIKPLLQPHLFDHYVVFYRGRYIYEDFHSGLGYNERQEDSLLKVGKAVTGANIIDQQVGGVNYKMFLQPINLYEGKRLIIAGLHTQDAIDKEKKQLPPDMALLVITIALCILLFLPWIKIYCLGKYDKLTLGDAAGSVLVAKLLISILILFFFKYNFSLNSETSMHSKKVLADAVQSAFKKEIDSAYTCMDKFDAIIYSNNMFYDVINLGSKQNIQRSKGADVFRHNYEYIGSSKDSITNVSNEPGSSEKNTFKDTLVHRYKKFYFTEINWMDSDGTVKYNWTRSGYNSVHANYKDREYFKNIRQGNTINPEEIQDMSFALDQVISRTDGGFRTIICKNSMLAGLTDTGRRASFVLLSFVMKSLDTVVMPAGYSFAIIDSKGEVKYHSNRDRNLNENLVDEFSTKKELQDALQGRFTEVFATKYYEDDYVVRVDPIKDYPYFIVIMSNQAYPDSVNIEIFSFTWSMILVFLIVAIIDLAILIITSSRHSLFKKQFLVANWLWPRESSRYEYLIAAAGNIIVIIFLVVGFNIFRYLPYFFILLFCIPLLTIFLNTIFLNKYKAKKNKDYFYYKVRCAYWSGGFLLLLNIFAVAALGWESYWPVILFEAGMIAAGWMLIYYYNHAILKEKKISAGFAPAYPHCYALMILTRLLVTSAIPVIFFYTASYNFEQNLMARYRLYDYSDRLQRKLKANSRIDGVFNKARVDTLRYRRGIYLDSTWIAGVNTCTDSAFFVEKKLSVEQTNTAALFNLFGEYLENICGTNNDNFYQSVSSDGYYRFNNIFSDVLYDTNGNKLFIPCRLSPDIQKKGMSQGSDSAGTLNGKTKYLVINSTGLRYFFPSLFSVEGAEFWLLLAAIILLFYLVLFTIVKRVFSLRVEHVPSWKENMGETKKILPERPLLWIVGLPSDDMLDMVIEDLKKTGENQFVERDDYLLDFDHFRLPADKKANEIDLQKINGDNYILRLEQAPAKPSAWDTMKTRVLESSSPYVLLLNLENKPDDAKTMTSKLECIESLLRKNKKVIIISATHPLYIQEMVIGEGLTENGFADPITARFSNKIFSNAPVIILPLIKNKYKEENEVPAETNGLKKVLDEETRYTGFLRELRETFIAENNTEQPIETRATGNGIKNVSADMLILQMQSFAHNFYLGLWQSLAADEKFILYDLAEDGLVNIKNSFAFHLLINKGIVVIEDGHPHIFNRSFRNFIVTSIGDHEMSGIHKMRAKSNSWSKMQMPLLLIVLAVFIFLAVSQEGMYTRMIGIISSVAAGIPALLKLLSMLGIQNNAETKNGASK